MVTTPFVVPYIGPGTTADPDWHLVVVVDINSRPAQETNLFGWLETIDRLWAVFCLRGDE